jgi:hypothetical protein
VIDTAGAAQAVSMIPQMPLQRIQLKSYSYRTSSVIDNASAALAVSMTKLARYDIAGWCRGPRIPEALAAFKGNKARNRDSAPWLIVRNRGAKFMIQHYVA